MYHNVQSLHKKMPKTTKCTVKSVKLMIRTSEGLHESNGVSNTSQKFRDGFLAVSASNTEVEEPFLEIARRSPDSFPRWLTSGFSFQSDDDQCVVLTQVVNQPVE